MKKEELYSKIVAACKDNNFCKEYLPQDASAIVVYGEKVVIIDKPKIKTRFCFHDDKAGLRMYKTFSEDDFIAENLRQLPFPSVSNEYGKRWFLYQKYNDTNIYEVAYCYYNKVLERIKMFPEQKGNIVEMTSEQVQQYKDMLTLEKSKFEKRLQAYLKRYGLSKIDKWTYWADR